MHSRLVAGVLAVAGLQAQAGDIPMTGVELRTEHRSSAGDVVAIHNRHQSPLVRWSIKVSAGGVSYTVTSDYSTYRGPKLADAGPIGPNQTRRTTYQNQRAGPAKTVAIELAVFANGEVQGTRTALRDLEQEATTIADELVFWQKTLDAMPQSEPFAYIREKFVERRRAVGEDYTGARSQLESFFNPDVPRPAWWLFRGVDDLKKDLAEQLARARSLSTNARTASNGVTTVDVSVEGGATDEVVIILKNLRSVPLEAWGYQEFAPGSTSAMSGFMSETMGTPAMAPGTGPIAPGETREIRALELARDRPAPTFAPWFAVWEDLVWQGSATERAAIMEGRRLRIESLAFWIAQLKAVTSMTPQAAIQSLRSALEEQRTGPTREQGGLTSYNLETFARTADRSPGQLQAQLEAFRQTLEQQHTRLTRNR